MPERTDKSGPLRRSEKLDFAAGTDVRLLDAVMLQRDLCSRDMDHLCGWKSGTFTALRSRGIPGEDTWPQIERALGCAIVTDSRTFDLRQACFKKFGFDPAILNAPELRTWVKKLALAHHLPSAPRRADYVDAILRYFSVNSGSLKSRQKS